MKVLICLALFATTLSACDAASVPAPSTPSGATPAAGATAPPVTSPIISASYENVPCGAYREVDNLVGNGDLEAPIVRQERQIFATGSKFTNWMIDAGSVAVLGSSFPMASGVQSAALSGTLSQTVSPLPGKTNILTFCYTAEPGTAQSAGLSVSWSGQSMGTVPVDAPVAKDAQPVWKGIRMALPPASGFLAPLSFSGQGVLIDAVRVSLE